MMAQTNERKKSNTSHNEEKRAESMLSKKSVSAKSKKSRRSVSRKKSIPIGPPKLTQPVVVNSDEEPDLKLRKSSSPISRSRQQSKKQKPNLPFIPLRHNFNPNLVKTKIRNPSEGYLEFA